MRWAATTVRSYLAEQRRQLPAGRPRLSTRTAAFSPDAPLPIRRWPQSGDGLLLVQRGRLCRICRHDDACCADDRRLDLLAARAVSTSALLTSAWGRRLRAMLAADRPSGLTVRPPVPEAEAPGEPALTTRFGAVGTVMSKMMDERKASVPTWAGSCRPRRCAGSRTPRPGSSE